MEAVVTELALVALAAMMSPTTLTFSVLVLVLGRRPLRTGAWFYAGALTVTLAVGVVAAFAIGDVASSSKPNAPKTPVAIIDVVAGALVLAYALRIGRRPVDPARIERMVGQMSKVADSPAIAIVGAGAMLANPGGCSCASASGFCGTLRPSPRRSSSYSPRRCCATGSPGSPPRRDWRNPS